MCIVQIRINIKDFQNNNNIEILISWIINWKQQSIN